MMIAIFSLIHAFYFRKKLSLCFARQFITLCFIGCLYYKLWTILLQHSIAGKARYVNA